MDSPPFEIGQLVRWHPGLGQYGFDVIKTMSVVWMEPHAHPLNAGYWDVKTRGLDGSRGGMTWPTEMGLVAA